MKEEERKMKCLTCQVWMKEEESKEKICPPPTGLPLYRRQAPSNPAYQQAVACTLFRTAVGRAPTFMFDARVSSNRRRSRRASLSNLWPPCQVYSDRRVEQRPCGKEVSTWLPSWHDSLVPCQFSFGPGHSVFLFSFSFDFEEIFPEVHRQRFFSGDGCWLTLWRPLDRVRWWPPHHLRVIKSNVCVRTTSAAYEGGNKDSNHSRKRVCVCVCARAPANWREGERERALGLGREGKMPGLVVGKGREEG